jgi:hypothetical protein
VLCVAGAGEAYVVFKDSAEAVKAKEELNKKSIMGRWIDLFQVRRRRMMVVVMMTITRPPCDLQEA